MEKYDESSVNQIVKVVESLVRDEVKIELKTLQYNDLINTYPPKDEQIESLREMIHQDKEQYCTVSDVETIMNERPESIPPMINSMINRISNKRKTLCSLVRSYQENIQ